MEMVRHQGPGAAGGSRFTYDLAKPAEKILPVRVILINPAALNRNSGRIPRRLRRG